MKINKKVLFVLPTLSAGGAERIMSFIAQNINRTCFEPHLLIIGYESKAAYKVQNINITFLNKKRVLTGIPSLVIFLLKFQPKIIISSIGHLNTVLGLLAPLFFKSKFIIREASVVSIMSKFSTSGKLYSVLARWAYRNVHAVVCQSQDMAKDFINIYQIPTHKIHIINNPITEVHPIKVSPKTQDLIRFITVGRLGKEKGHLRVLEILARIKYPFKYTIIGDGPEREMVFKKAQELGLTEKITHIPFTNKVSEELSNHDIFLQGSFVEGFPNAVLESCVVGTPVMAFDVPGGTKEIISSGLNGYLVKNNIEFLDRLENCSKLDPKKIRNSVLYKFDKETILKQYERLIASL